MDINDSHQQLDHNNVTTKSKKKCHGNRRNQRFRKRCRARQMKPSTIEKLLQRRTQLQTTSAATATTTANTKSYDNNYNQTKNEAKQITTHNHKRKRFSSCQELQINQVMTKSTSSTSIALPLSKKVKTKAKSMTELSVKLSKEILNKNYRRPLYLKRPFSMVLQKLSQTMKYPLKQNDEQTFIYTRLDFFDQQYWLVAEKHLWQFYIDMSLSHHLWPDRLYTLAQTNDFDICQQYAMNYLENLEKQLNECQFELLKQSQTCPIQMISLHQIDQCLQGMVERERKYLRGRNDHQLEQFKKEIDKQDLLRQISTYHLTMNQNECLHRLLTIQQRQANIWKELLMLETRILCKFLPLNFNHLEHWIAPLNLYSPMIMNSKTIQFNNRRSQIIKETKRNWLNISFNVSEFKIQECEEQYQSEFKQLQTQLLNGTTTTENGTLVYNLLQEYLTHERTKLKKDIHRQVSLFRAKLLRQRRHSSQTKHTTGVSSEPYFDLISNPFSKTEWNYLSLGSSCIRLNQSALRSEKQQKIEIRDEHKEIFNKVQKELVEHHHTRRTLPIFQDYSNQLLAHLNRAYFTSLSYKDHIQALEQIQVVRSIRKKIKKHHLLLRLTDKGNSFCIGLTNEFEKKVKQFFSDTNAFAELSYNPFNEILDKVIQFLNRLASKKLILQWQCKKMMPDRANCELAHLYFNPKTHKDGIPIRPIESTIRTSTRNISIFLDQLLRPIFNEKCHTTIIIDGTSLIDELHKYVAKGLLKPTTLFCTFDIHNLYTMLPQDEALDILVEFLQVHGYTRVKGINLQTIRDLASIVLQENVFVYGNKIYKQILDGAMGSSFTLTLANIFMWKWQKELVRQQDITGEYYGRYIDDIFMTWNKSEKELIKLLEAANKYHPNIQFDYQIGSSLPFLDVFLTNNNGILSTSVYHKPTSEPYVVPFISDHPRHVFGNVVQTALTRAIRYSSTFEVYEQERRHIKLTLLYNGYPSLFIEKEFQKFFREYKSISPFLPYIDHETQFSLKRNQLLGPSTTVQIPAAMDTLTVANSNALTTANTLEMNTSIQIIQNEKKSYQDRLIIHYKHEKRFHSFKRDLHQIHDSIFNNTPVHYVKLIVGHKNRRDARHELIRKRPKRFILKNTTKKKRRRQKRTKSHPIHPTI